MPCEIRLATPEDGSSLASIYAPAVIARATSFELEPPDAAEMARRVARTTLHLPWLVCESGQVVLGYVYASAHRERPAYRWSVEVSAYMSEKVHRVGLGRALYGALFGVLALQGYRNALAGIALPNPASVGLHEALGFDLVGVYRGVGYKLGRWHDVGWWQKDLSPRGLEPEPPHQGTAGGAAFGRSIRLEPPRSLPEIVSEPAFSQALRSGERLLDEARIAAALTDEGAR